MAKKIFGIDFGTNVIKVYKKGEGIILLERTGRDRKELYQQ